LKAPERNVVSIGIAITQSFLSRLEYLLALGKPPHPAASKREQGNDRDDDKN
jgi:hypothetical protein